MNPRRVTIALLLVATVVLCVWDMFAASNRQGGDTISEVIRQFAHDYPIVAVAWGVLTCHFFWSKGAN